VDFENLYDQIDAIAGDQFLDDVEDGLGEYCLSLPYSASWLVWSLATMVSVEAENVSWYADRILPDWMPSTWYLLAMMPIYWLVNFWDPTHARLARRSVACQVLSVAYRGARRVACGLALAFVALAGAASAQITCTDKPVRVLSGVGESVVTGDYLILPDGAPGNILKATQVSLGGCDGWLVAAKASDSKRNPVAVSEIAPCNYLVLSNQPVWLSVTAIDFANQGFDTAEFLLNPDAPEPEPEPDDPDVPDDPDEPDVPGPAPIDGDGLRVLFIHESSEQLPRELGPILYGPEITRYLNANCVKVDGQPDFRRLDPDTQFTDPNHRFAKALKRPRTQDPWLIISNGTSGYEGPFPGTVQETLDLIQRYTPVQARAAAPTVVMITTDHCIQCEAFKLREMPNLGELVTIAKKVPGVLTRQFPTFVVRAGGEESILTGYQTAEQLRAEIKRLESL
jgi:hypothetical protein